MNCSFESFPIFFLLTRRQRKKSLKFTFSLLLSKHKGYLSGKHEMVHKVPNTEFSFYLWFLKPCGNASLNCVVKVFILVYLCEQDYLVFTYK